MSPINKKERDYKMTLLIAHTIPAQAAKIVLHAVEGLRLSNDFDLYSYQHNGVYGDFHKAAHRAIALYFTIGHADEFLEHLSATGEVPTWFTNSIRPDYKAWDVDSTVSASVAEMWGAI